MRGSVFGASPGGAHRVRNPAPFELAVLRRPVERGRAVRGLAEGRHDEVDLLEVMHASPGGLAVRDAASLVFETDTPSAAQIEKARRRLESLVKKELATSEKDLAGVVRFSRVRERERP